MAIVVEHDVSVVLSSHLVADLERVCDYLVVLVASRVQVAGEIDELLASHHRLCAPRRDGVRPPSDWEVIEASDTDRQSTLIVRHDEPIHDPTWTVEQLNLEDLVLAYMGRASGNGAPVPGTRRSPPMIRLAWRQFRAEARRSVSVRSSSWPWCWPSPART